MSFNTANARDDNGDEVGEEKGEYESVVVEDNDNDETEVFIIEQLVTISENPGLFFGGSCGPP